MGMTRLIARGAAVWGAAILGEALYAVLYPVPDIQEYDASTVAGDQSLPPLRIVAIGDSTLTGAALDDPHDIWIRQLARRLADRFFVTVDSYAVGGATSREVRRSQLDSAIRAAGDLTFVSVGANDALKGVPINTYAANLDAIVRALTAAGTTVVVSGVGDLGTIPRLLTPLDTLIGRRGKRFDQVAAEVAARHRATKVDMWGLTAEKFRTMEGIFSVDRFHPTRLGHSIWADAAEITVEPLLSRFA